VRVKAFRARMRCASQPRVITGAQANRRRVSLGASHERDHNAVNCKRYCQGYQKITNETGKIRRRSYGGVGFS
jgi:hypothetical protein